MTLSEGGKALLTTPVAPYCIPRVMFSLDNVEDKNSLFSSKDGDVKGVRERALAAPIVDMSRLGLNRLGLPDRSEGLASVREEMPELIPVRGLLLYRDAVLLDIVDAGCDRSLGVDLVLDSISWISERFTELE